ICDEFFGKPEATVVCRQLGTWFNIRLVGSSSASQGRVEVLVNGEWGSVCESYAP
ncbi:lysyl oxidase homolog 3B-like, partial [Patella vulgata]|uniref:lysyl oxidase homolog 3B-like n=1 Tax=Patella vulgata TaxID=6465 RepID=UPI0021807895